MKLRMLTTLLALASVWAGIQEMTFVQIMLLLGTLGSVIVEIREMDRRVG